MKKDLGLYGLTVGPYGTNCYLIINKKNGQALVVDPGDESRAIMDQCKKNGGRPSAILLTHGHWDHAGGVAGIRRAFPEIMIYASEKEKPLLQDPSLNAGMGETTETVIPDIFVRDGDRLEPAGIPMRVISTPGHTAGSVCYYLEDEKLLLAGDTVFKESYGRCDMPTGSESDMRQSLKRLAALLPDDTQILPGHGPLTTMAYEKRFNPGL